MPSRREFLGAALPAVGAVAGCQALGNVIREATRVPPIPRIRVDGLGEIRLDYDGALLDEIRASGLRGCVVTVGNPALQGSSAFADLADEVREYDRHIAANATRLSRAQATGDLDRALARETIGLLYYTQNATPIEDDLGRLETLKQLGVRIIQLTYNTRNLLGDGCLERTDAGLSRFGVEVVARMNDLSLLVDVSHCGEATSRDAIEQSRLPVAVTHAGCRAVYDHPRNKSDAVLAELARRGGVIGIYQINPYLGPRERNTLDDYLRHLDHAIAVCGIDHVAVGSDREHRRIPDTAEERWKLEEELSPLGRGAGVRWPFFLSELNHPRRMDTIAEALTRRGMPEADIDKVLGGNWYRLLRETIG